MAKANFTKVEKALEEGLTQITSKKLLEEAAAINPKGKKLKNLPTKENASIVIQTIHGEMRELHKQDPAVFKKFGMTQKAFKKLLESASEITPEEWNRIKEIRKQVEQYKRELAAKLPQASDEEIVQKERKKHITKRFNVREKWLPLQ